MPTIEIKSRKLNKANYKSEALLYAYTAEDATIASTVSMAISDGVDLEYADLRRADLRDANLCGAQLANANLSRADLQDTDLRGANLFNANLHGANLSYADLRGADLVSASLSEAYLQAADLRFADLEGASLFQTNLRDTTLAFSILRGADLDRAGLSSVNFDGADMRRAKLGGGHGGSKSLRQLLWVPNLDKQILHQITANPALLSRSYNHDGEAHSRLGWAITLAGPAGVAVQAIWGPDAAGAFVYAASYPHMAVPDFSASHEDTLRDIQQRAAQS